MVRAWYIDDDPSDPRNEHHRSPPEFLSLETLFEITGVEYFKLNMDTVDSDGVLDKIKLERGSTYEDELICSRECLPNYEERIKSFFQEHLHADEEIRLVADGSGYFDVRDKKDEWIRIEVEKGDLLILPGGIYHRFSLDRKNYFRVRRLFIRSPIWKAYSRPSDDMECRKEYVKSMESGKFVKTY